MTNIKTHGFKNPAELRERLAELDDELPTDDQQQAVEYELRLAISDMQREVDELRRRLDAVSRRRPSSPALEPHPWLRIVATAAATFVLGRVVRRLRLGAPGAVAVPLLAAKFGDRIVRSSSRYRGLR